MNEQNLKPFPKGVSGNPKGHPKGQKNFSTILKKILDNAKGEVDGKPADGWLILAATLYKKATKQEDIKAIREILDRLEGKAKQSIAHSGGIEVTYAEALKLIDAHDKESNPKPPESAE